MSPFSPKQFFVYHEFHKNVKIKNKNCIRHFIKIHLILFFIIFFNILLFYYNCFAVFNFMEHNLTWDRKLIVQRKKVQLHFIYLFVSLYTFNINILYSVFVFNIFFYFDLSFCWFCCFLFTMMMMIIIFLFRESHLDGTKKVIFTTVSFWNKIKSIYLYFF